MLCVQTNAISHLCREKPKGVCEGGHHLTYGHHCPLSQGGAEGKVQCNHLHGNNIDSKRVKVWDRLEKTRGNNLWINPSSSFLERYSSPFDSFLWPLHLFLCFYWHSMSIAIMSCWLLNFGPLPLIFLKKKMASTNPNHPQKINPVYLKGVNLIDGLKHYSCLLYDFPSSSPPPPITEASCSLPQQKSWYWDWLRPFKGMNWPSWIPLSTSKEHLTKAAAGGKLAGCEKVSRWKCTAEEHFKETTRVPRLVS